ncbi:ATP synthase subunit I [Thalassotalea profundi]|uniref:F0F1 ATP synthase assembly protein I n=1 Tax=Thalassotalea profundi TaxID=2036687 RepID=A0ABQ3J1U9_9GAMM|nr:ATP synthase subunit I [Thalassotalea profundi]GHE96230.1 hypothetical protein GCM10011501_27340 [Thalassotalea profundi]
MNNKLATVGRKIALTQILFTTVLMLLITLMVYFIWGANYAKSAFVGGIIAIIPNIIFAFKAFKYAGAQSARKVMESFYSGVKIKMLYTALLFALAFKFLVITPVALLSTYCVVVFLPLLLPAVLREH